MMDAQTKHVVELTGPPEVVRKFVDAMRRQATDIDEIESDADARVFCVTGIDPVFDMELESFTGLTVSGSAFYPGYLVRMIRLQHEPPPGLGEETETYNNRVLSLVAAEVERLGGEVIGTNNIARGEIPVSASAPTGQGIVVGAVAVAVLTPLREECVGIVRVDELGVVRVSPPSDREWSGPFLR